jgi:two-component system response regulator HydG
MSQSVLIVDDDADLRSLVELHLRSEGFGVRLAVDATTAIEACKADLPAAMVLDLMLPDRPGKEVLGELHERYPSLPIIILTALRDVGDAVDCMRLGAVDYLQKPFDKARLVTSVRNAAMQGALRTQVESLASELRRREGFATIIGNSASIRATVHMLARAATSDVTVLLEGESGTGKEVAARAIHAEGVRADAPFIAVNCGAIPEGLIETELFGHEKGAFTGAVGARRGCFEQANGGTIFLDEIGELRGDLQVRLLRVLQERQVQPVGGGTPRTVDVRVIAATNRDLRDEVVAGRFREDLFYRLAVFPVQLPALRERGSDVLLLASYFVERYARRNRKEVHGFSPEAQRALERYRWPGNVRELENVIERAIILEDEQRVRLSSLPPEVSAAVTEGPLASNGRYAGATPGGQTVARESIVPLDEEERRIIRRALELTNWNIQEASRRLRIGRATIYRKIERYGLMRPDGEDTDRADPSDGVRSAARADSAPAAAAVTRR